MKLVASGLLRAYYNGTDEARPWCVDMLSASSGLAQIRWEGKLQATRIPLAWIFDAAVPNEREGPPRAYVEGYGSLWADEATLVAVIVPVGDKP